MRKSEKVESVHPAVAFSVKVTHPGDQKKSDETFLLKMLHPEEHNQLFTISCR